jgi:hypothetical protein
MIETLTVSSGMPANNSAVPKGTSDELPVIGKCRCSHSSSKAAGKQLSAPRPTAIHTMRGGSGRLSAATTSQSSSKAGAMAEATMSPGMRSVSNIRQ